jgi:hypothetical protein
MNSENITLTLTEERIKEIVKRFKFNLRGRRSGRIKGISHRAPIYTSIELAQSYGGKVMEIFKNKLAVKIEKAAKRLESAKRADKFEQQWYSERRQAGQHNVGRRGIINADRRLANCMIALDELKSIQNSLNK